MIKEEMLRLAGNRYLPPNRFKNVEVTGDVREWLEYKQKLQNSK